MQKALSLNTDFIKVAKTQELGDYLMPWEVESFDKDFERAEKQGGVFDLSNWSTIRFQGPDSLDYLNRMSTVNFKLAELNSVTPGAFLNGKAGVIALGFFLVEADCFYFILPAAQKAAAFFYLHKYHFNEKIEITDATDKFSFFGLWNPNTELTKSFELSGIKKTEASYRRFLGLDFELWKDNRRPLFWIKMNTQQATLFLKEIYRGLNSSLLGARLFEYFRIDAGITFGGTELNEERILLEGAFPEAIARNKGCYPGQEVIERIFTYGQVNRLLHKVNVEKSAENSWPKLPVSISSEQKTVLEIVTIEEVPNSPQKAVALGYVHKDFWKSTNVFKTANGVSFKIVNQTTA